MLGRLFRRGPRDSSIPSALYGAIVAQARVPALYSDIGIADTVDGRFESVVLHTVLALRRLGKGDEEMKAAGQGAFDLFCTEMDRSLREMGVSDLRVPKRMRKIGEVYYGRAVAYEAALAADDEIALADAVARAVPPAEGREVATAALAAYMKACDATLMAASKAELLAGRLPFAEAAAFLQAEKDDDHRAASGEDR